MTITGQAEATPQAARQHKRKRAWRNGMPMLALDAVFVSGLVAWHDTGRCGKNETSDARESVLVGDICIRPPKEFHSTKESAAPVDAVSDLGWYLAGESRKGGNQGPKALEQQVEQCNKKCCQ
eukprot:CAMPEP_0116832658 /NCGR_PEP_ID=MMETSP0418-20121206/6012_1 /TAXON_ID=1158023 /ORGANISM="Astrosyne radiata, Strain 13vi08-1A" /LENGTH=122 /DNA_ID=CAMNT_0004462039 /DNA_START=563 /DNA_END=931 /DNA_ORIENTATION=-